MSASSVKVVCLLNQIALPLSYMGLNLGCIVQHFLHGGAIPGCGAFPDGVGESSEERESLDDIEYRQLLKDYRKAQANLSLTRLNVEMLRADVDAVRGALHCSMTEVLKARVD